MGWDCHTFEMASHAGCQFARGGSFRVEQAMGQDVRYPARQICHAVLVQTQPDIEPKDFGPAYILASMIEEHVASDEPDAA